MSWPAAIAPALPVRRRILLLGVPVDTLSRSESVDIAAAAMRGRSKPVRHVALNVAKFIKMRSDPDLAADVAESDIVGIDGMGIVWALRMFGVKGVVRVPGVDLMFDLLEWCAREGRRPFVLGARREILEEAAAAAAHQYPGLQFAGLRDGYFSPLEEADVVRQIRESGADCLFVAMPTPRKERFLGAYAKELGVPFVMGVGGSVDILAGRLKRAPKLMQRAGLEWLHRLLQEPRRMFWRYASTNTVFIFLIVRAIFQRPFGKPPVVRCEPIP